MKIPATDNNCIGRIAKVADGRWHLSPLVRMFVGYWLIVLFTPLSQAHDLNFGVLTVDELNEQEYQFGFRFISQKVELNDFQVGVETNCVDEFTERKSKLTFEVDFKWVSRCESLSVGGEQLRLSMKGLPENQAILLRLTLRNGQLVEQLIRSNNIVLSDIIASSESKSNVLPAYSYFKVGFEHILIGYDHLLVVFCFLLLFESIKKVL